MKNEIAKTIGKGIATGLGLVALGIIGSKLESDDESTGYSKAVRAIVDSNMFDSAKQQCLGTIKTGKSDELYDAVIAIVNSDSFDSTKVEMIKQLF